MEDPAVTNFRNFLKIKSNHPDPDYDGCIEWIKEQGKDIGLEFNIHHLEPPALFVTWLTWAGRDPTLSSVFLYCHLDVVPVDYSRWTRDPFSAYKDEKGNIFARGSQDMKCVGVQYLEAIKRLKAQGFSPLRTVHVAFAPDEEVGGYKGVCPFIKTKAFEDLNIGFALDEGIANPASSFDVFYGERAIWQIKVTATGQTGHGSLLHNNTAAEKIHKVLNSMMEIRASEKARLESDPKLNLGDVTTINLTMLEGGCQPNVVPSELSVVFDIRITPMWNHEDFHKKLESIISNAGSGVTYTFIQKTNVTEPTKLDDSNPWWITFKKTCDEMGCVLNELIFPAATDIRYLRQVGIPALGFSPMNNTPILLHDHDEFLNENVFLKGIEIYEKILANIFNVPKH